MLLMGLWLSLAGCLGCGGHGSAGPTAPPKVQSGPITTAPISFALDATAAGVYETVNNIANLTVVSTDSNALKAEYRAGYVQGHLQQHGILSARDNTLGIWTLSPSDLAYAQTLLTANYTWMISYLQTNVGTVETQRLTRLLFRMLGIYHGATLNTPASLDFSGAWLPSVATFQPSELTLTYQAPRLSFLDVYLVNAAMDLEDVLAYGTTGTAGLTKAQRRVNLKQEDWPLHCSAFVKRTTDDIVMGHATWTNFLTQTMAMTLNVNGDMVTLNAITPGQIGSGTDFGYNNRGLMFNETTHAYAYTEPKVQAIWIFWRAALAEQFAGSIDEFFNNISLSNSGTYLNGYMLVDAKTKETALVDMSYKTFVLFRSSGGAYTATTKPTGLSTDYDAVMATPDYLMGYSFPVSTLIRTELASSYDSPRRGQFQQLLPTVTDLTTAKAVITHFDPAVRGSIYGRFDVGGTRPSPSGAVDAKVASASMARAFMQLGGTLDVKATNKGFWMQFGTARINNQPFIWSRSQWSTWAHPDVPDALEGGFTAMNLFLR